MIVTDRLNKDRFGQLLARALQKHSEPVPSDFTARMLTAIKQAEQQRILDGIVLQQRLALAASIVLGAGAAIAAIFFPAEVAGVLRNIAGSIMEQVSVWFDRVPQAIKTIGDQWQFCAVLAAVFGLVVCTLIDLLLGDRLRIA
jgi:hypothetical protein